MMHPRRRCLVAVGLTLALLLPQAILGSAAQAAPATPAFGPSIDPLSPYVGQTTCDPTAKPGAVALRDLLEATYPETTPIAIGRSCEIGGVSEHKEGRAYDWGVNAFDARQKAMAADLLTWLLATDAHGNVNAMARRLGIMYVIWNGQVWKSYGTNRGWQTYTGSNPHTDHVHFSLSWDGAYKRTSWYAPPTPTVPQAGVAFHPLTPRRIVDTRPSTQVGAFGTPWAAGQTREVTVNGVGGVPVGAGAVALNVTVTGTTGNGFLTVWPTGQARPQSSSLNWSPGRTIANAVTARVGSGGRISLYNSAGRSDVVIDVVGYYDADPGSGFTTLTPARIADSRPGQVGPYVTPWTRGQTRDLVVAGVGGVPLGAHAVVANVTVTSTTAFGYLAVWPSGLSRPQASSLNWSPGQTIPNLVTVKVGAGGKISVYNDDGQADVIVDVVGFFGTGGQLFHPLPPARIQDSRTTGPQVGPWGAGAVREVQVGGAGGIPSGAAAALANVTVTNTTAPSHLAVWPAGQADPGTSSLNWTTGETIPNAVSAKLGVSGRIAVSNNAGGVDVVVDVSGWYG